MRKLGHSSKGRKNRSNKNATQTSFEHSFSSEVLLQQAIASLLTRMPDITGVQILQGAQELGKDLIFNIKGGFGEAVLCACVVKNTKITGDAGKKVGARTVLFQAEQAFDSTYTDSFGKDLRVERVYVVTPYNIPPETITSIKGRLQERAGQVVFISGSTLFDLFRKYWPDYLADEAELIERHLKETRNTFEDDSPLQSLATQFNLGAIGNYAKKIYVSQSFYSEIHRYELGSKLCNPMWSLDKIDKGLRREDVQFIQDELHSLKSAMTLLHEWECFPKEEMTTIDRYSQSIMTTLRSALEKAAAEKAEEKPLAELRRKDAELRHQEEDIKNEIKILERKGRDINEINQRLKEAQKERTKIQRDARTLHKRLGQLQQDKTAARRNIEERLQRLEHLNTETQKNIQGFTERLKQLEQEIEEAQQKIQSLTERLQPVQQRRMAEQRKIQQLMERLASIEQEKVAQLSTATRLAKKLNDRRSEALSLSRKSLADLQRTLLSGNLDGIKALSHPSFLQTCIMDTGVRTAPADTFISKLSLRVSFPKDILNEWDKHLMIVGSPGYGKTSFCRWHALQDAESFSLGKSNIIPVYVPLYQFSRRQLGSFEDSFLKNLGKSALLSDTTAGANGSNIRVRLYLDGLDEIASHEQRRQVVNLAKIGAAGGIKYQIILTARDYIYAEWLGWLPRITLGGFSDEDINELVNRWLGQNSDNNKRFWTQINAMAALTNLMRTPLLATLIIMVFRQTGGLPESRASLYESFIKLLSGGWDLVKGVLRESKFGERVKLQVLGTLANNLQESRRREFSGQDLKKALNSTMSGPILKEWEVLQDELIIDGLLTKSGNILQFSHHSFQEFLAAKDFIGSPEPTRANRALEAYLRGDDWWGQVLEFYIGMSTNPTEITEWLTNQIWTLRSRSVNVINSQIESLRDALSESFPRYSREAIKSIGFKGSVERTPSRL
jgi:uncharacterized coiled-coil protein SlyX